MTTPEAGPPPASSDALDRALCGRRSLRTLVPARNWAKTTTGRSRQRHKCFLRRRSRFEMCRDQHRRCAPTCNTCLRPFTIHTLPRQIWTLVLREGPSWPRRRRRHVAFRLGPPKLPHEHPGGLPVARRTCSHRPRGRSCASAAGNCGASVANAGIGVTAGTPARMPAALVLPARA